MRLFTAIALSEEARAAIAEEQQRLRAALGEVSRSLRFVSPEHMHLTLVFIGEVAENRSVAIVEVMRQSIGLPPFRLILGAVGTFPPRGAARIVWLGALDGAREAIDLHALVAARLAGAGVNPEARPFHPHLTLARVKGAVPLFRTLFREKGVRPLLPLDVTAVTLYQSKLSSTGPTYTALARAHLQHP